jgi:imidazoleglycerol-phosphate dehydratase / histidinol-phosphatase
MTLPKRKKPVLFLDRDGLIVKEQQVDSFERIEWIPGVFHALRQIRSSGLYYLVMVSNQDGVGLAHYPSDAFWGPHNRIIETLAGEGIVFDAVHLDFSMPEDNSPNRKPGIGMLGEYLDGSYDLERSLVVGDRLTDVELARNLGCKGIWFADDSRSEELKSGSAGELGLSETCLLVTESWDRILQWLLGADVIRAHRTAVINRETKETAINLRLDLDGTGVGMPCTGLPFFDHMLHQIIRHGQFDADLIAKGDLLVDEHHTVEDVAIVLGQAVAKALGDKRGISRYGFELLTMDDCLAQVALDFSGRPWFKWDVTFSHTSIGEFPTELFFHFFKSFSDEARCNLHMSVSQGNSHHQAEALFKAFGRALRSAVFRYPWNNDLPSTKGVL